MVAMYSYLMKMGIDVTDLGLPSPSRRKEKGKGDRNPLEKRWDIGYFLTLVGQKAVTSIPILLGHYRQIPL